MQQTITYGNENIPYQVIFSERQTLDISVYPNQQVIVKAPTGTPLEKIAERVKRRARWILKQQLYFQSFDPRTPPRRYISGETHLYLGRQYRLKVEKRSYSRVKLKGPYIYVHTPQLHCSDTIQQMLEDWYTERAYLKLAERLDICFPRFQKYGFNRPPLYIRRLSKRWGSLTPSGNILLNRDLIRASTACIDYVITHELCHLKHPNHSPSFYAFLSLIMPDWEARKQRLEILLV